LRLTPHEQERLLISYAAGARAAPQGPRPAAEPPETVAVLCSFVLEGARDGRSVVDLMADGREVLTRADVMEGVPEMLSEVQVEATFPDGSKLVTLHHPIP
jgi:urease subunit gamma